MQVIDYDNIKKRFCNKLDQVEFIKDCYSILDPDQFSDDPNIDKLAAKSMPCEMRVIWAVVNTNTGKHLKCGYVFNILNLENDPEYYADYFIKFITQEAEKNKFDFNVLKKIG